MIIFTDSYREKAREFKKMFGYGVPLDMIPPVESTEGLIKNIDICLQKKKDILLDLYNVKIDRATYY